MIESTERRRRLGWMAGAGLACLGAGSIFSSGCSTTTVADLHGSAKSGQQVASNDKSTDKKSAAGKKSAKQVASKDAPARVRITDLDDESRAQMAARVARQRSSGQQSNPVNSLTRRSQQATEIASAPVINPAASANQPVGAGRTDAPTAARQERVVATGSTRQRGSQAVAANARMTGAITQTAGDAESPPAIAQRSTRSGGATRPVITPRKTEWQPENGGEIIPSNHERLRADRLMQRATTMYENGYREEALRLAFVAAELEKSRQAVYKRGEQRPSDFINLVQTSSAGSGNDQSIAASQSHFKPRSTKSADRARLALPSRENIAADASVLPQAARDPNPEPVRAPHFATDDKGNLVAAANPGKVDVPLPQTPRNAEVSVVTADGGSRTLEPTPNSNESQGVVAAEQVQGSGDPASSPKMLLAKAPAPAPLAAAADADNTEVEASADADAPLPLANHTSQLTIASLVGLLTGVAGMIGLGWWRRQEREHYAAGKSA